MRVLVPVDGSDSSLAALRFVIDKLVPAAAGLELPLLNVQPALPSSASRFIASKLLRDYHQDDGVKDLAADPKLLAAARQASSRHLAIGHPADRLFTSATP